MTETYYFRLPFYLWKNQGNNRTADVYLDNELISSIEVSSDDRNTMNYMTFSVTKEPGLYWLKIKDNYTTETEEIANNRSIICLDDVFVSNDNVNFYSLLLNYNGITVLNNTIPNDGLHGFDPSKGGILWHNFGDGEFSVEVRLADSENWPITYRADNLSKFKEWLDFKIQRNAGPEEIESAQIAIEWFEKRGYT